MINFQLKFSYKNFSVDLKIEIYAEIIKKFKMFCEKSIMPEGSFIYSPYKSRFMRGSFKT